MYNATLYFRRSLDQAVIRAENTGDPAEFAHLIGIIKHLKLAIYALERLEEQDANK